MRGAGGTNPLLLPFTRGDLQNNVYNFHCVNFIINTVFGYFCDVSMATIFEKAKDKKFRCLLFGDVISYTKLQLKMLLFLVKPHQIK